MSNIIRFRTPSFSIQCNNCPSLRWSDVRETAGRAASRLGNSIQKAGLHVQRLLHVEPLFPERFQSIVMHSTGLSTELAQIVIEYHFPAPNPNPFVTVIAAAAIAGMGSAAVVGAMAVTGVDDAGILLATVAGVRGMLPRRFRVAAKDLSISAAIAVLAKGIGVGAYGATATVVAGTVLAGMAIETVAASRVPGVSVCTIASRALCRGFHAAKWGGMTAFVIFATPQLGRLLEVEALAFLAMDLAADVTKRVMMAVTGGDSLCLKQRAVRQVIDWTARMVCGKIAAYINVTEFLGGRPDWTPQKFIEESFVAALMVSVMVQHLQRRALM